MSKSVLIDYGKVIVEVAHDGLEALVDKKLSGEDAVLYVTKISQVVARLANIVPADDGKIHITKNLLLNDGILE